MKRQVLRVGLALGTICLAGLLACQPTEKKEAPIADKAQPEAETSKLRGVDVDKKVIRIGILNDESGPAAAIGKPFAVGKRILAAQVNAGGSGILPDGWKVELVEKDHGYNPGKSEQAYKEIKDNIWFIGTSFGTPNTLPLRPFLKQDNMVAFPASLSSEMAGFEYTPPAGPSYGVEAMRAMDWVVTSAGGADKVKAAIIYDQTDYGKDGHKGWTVAAANHKVEIVSEQTIAPGQKDFVAVVAGLKKAGATHVLLTVLPSSTGPILGTAAKMQFMPNWIGNTPSWIDPFFAHPQLPAAVFTNFYWASSLPFWGEARPGMDKFLAAFAAHGKAFGRPDFYILTSYVQGLAALEVAKRAIEAGDMTPGGFMKALRGVKSWNAGGLIEPLNFVPFPYVTSTRTRVLKPDFAKKSWVVVAGFAEPQATATVAAAPAKAPEAKPQ